MPKIRRNWNHSRESSDPLADIHAAGAERHPAAWIMANQAAINAANARRIRLYDADG